MPKPKIQELTFQDLEKELQTEYARRGFGSVVPKVVCRAIEKMVKANRDKRVDDVDVSEMYIDKEEDMKVLERLGYMFSTKLVADAGPRIVWILSR